MNRRGMLAPYPPTQDQVGPTGRSARGYPTQIRDALRSGRWDVAIRLAMGTGVTDVNQLTDTLFYVLHPELRGRRIDSSQRALGQEWLDIRDRRVKPVLESRGRSPAGVPAGPTAQPGSVRMFFGVDTADAENNGADWLRAKAQVPIDFAIIRAYGDATQHPRPDDFFPGTWPKLKDAGLVRGAYLIMSFPRGRGWPSSPVTQARGFITAVKNLDKSDLAPVLDVEANNWQQTGMNPSQLLGGVRAAWKTLRDYYGVAPIVYTSIRVWQEVLGNLSATDLKESPLWVKDAYIYAAKRPARYDPQIFAGGRNNPRVPKPWGDAANWWIHQYQGDALGLPGFRSTADLNRFSTMVRGATGDRVRWVQRRLRVPESGAFDAATERALRAFQISKGVGATGVIDPRTFAYLCWSNPSPA
jgi:GH25 family lysozyme M1 (1,4-beta-N-acetylmuramidase)